MIESRRRWRTGSWSAAGVVFCFCSLITVLAVKAAVGDQANRASPSDEEIQKEIDKATAFLKSKYGFNHSAWSEVEKDRLVVINHLKPFGKAPGQEAVFLTPMDQIDVEAYIGAAQIGSEARPLTLQEVRGWAHPGATRVLLTVWGSALGTRPGVKYAVPTVEMTLTADGIELHPLDGPAEPLRLRLPTVAQGQQGSLPVMITRSWFLFDISPNAAKITVAVTFPNGYKDEKTFDGSKLTKPTSIQAGRF